MPYFCSKCKDKNLLKVCECRCGTIIASFDKNGIARRFENYHSRSDKYRFKPNYFCSKCEDKNFLRECECGCGSIIASMDRRGIPRRFKRYHRLSDKFNCKKCRDKNFLRECECGCGAIILAPRRFVNGHNQAGPRNHKWAGGRFITGEGVIMMSVGGRSVREHRLVYELHYNCRLLPYAEIRHLNGIKTDNRIENLQPVFEGVTAHFARAVPLDRKCIKCGTNHAIRANGKSDWHRTEGGYLCRKCHKAEYDRMPDVRKSANKQSMVRYWRTHERKKPIPPSRRCLICGSNKTYMIHDRKHANWNKVDGGYLCERCSEREERKIPEKRAKMQVIGQRYRKKVSHDRKIQRKMEKTQVFWSRVRAANKLTEDGYK